MIKIERVSHKYNLGLSNEVKALNNVSFSINDGDFIGIIGHSGSGKTTLLNVKCVGILCYDEVEMKQIEMEIHRYNKKTLSFNS